MTSRIGEPSSRCLTPPSVGGARFVGDPVDIVTGAIEDTGDYANSGLLRPIDDYVAKYRPSWNEPATRRVRERGIIPVNGFRVPWGVSTVMLSPMWRARASEISGR